MRYLIALALCSCSAAADPSPDFVIGPNVTLSPQIRLRGATQVAMDRWIAATCLDIQLGENGTLVQFGSPIGAPMFCPVEGYGGICTEPSENCFGCAGATDRADRFILVSGDVPRYEDRIGVLTHEIGHRLGTHSHVEPPVIDEIMNLHVWFSTDKIGEKSLNLVCGNNDCSCYNPEY